MKANIVMSDLESLVLSLKAVGTIHEFRNWVRFELRKQMPHAIFLGTAGRLYGIGSVPTHRVEVDFPLSMLEELKNSVGALNDPLLSSWLKCGKLRYVNLECGAYRDGHQTWCSVLEGFGIRNMAIHGVLDHKARRFASFQIGNIYSENAHGVTTLLAFLATEMARSAWKIFDLQTVGDARHFTGHPTLSLTPTELHIVELLARGLSNKEIARLRGVSDSTVKTQVQRTGAKLGATRRAEIVAIAFPMLSPLPPQSLMDYDAFD